MKSSWLIWVAVYFITACNTQKESSNCGVVVSRYKFFDEKIKNYQPLEIYGPDTKVWYQNAFVIQKRVGIRFKKMGNNPEERQVFLIGYTFIDLSQRSFYHYKNFSDTARMIAKWTQPDSVTSNEYGGVWNFYAPHNTEVTEPIEELTDTSINGINYKRMKFVNTNLFTRPVSVGYFRCDKKGTMFQYDKNLSDSIGCPLIRKDDIPTLQNPQAISIEIDFVATELTDEERKVFAAWKKNARENPVRK